MRPALTPADRAIGVMVAATLTVALSAAPRRAAAGELVPIPLDSLQGKLETQAAYELGPDGLRLAVDGNALVILPFTAEEVELDVDATGPVLFTWAARTPGVPFRPFGPPWRHLTLPRQRRTVTLDLRITEGWNASAHPAFGLTGSGTVTIHALRVLPVPTDRDELVADFDRARLWAPESPGHTTINFLTLSFWRASAGIWLSDVVALAAAVAFAAALGMSWLRRRRFGPARALAAAAVVAAGLWDVHLLVRFLPAFHLRPSLDVEERIRDHYDVAPDVGALAALARATLRPGERVGVMGVKGGWFAPQTICFDLAPRPCVIMTAGDPEPEYHGISGVGTLRADQLDAVVTYRAGPLPHGFAPVAEIGRTSVVARRQP